jgi:hypothetical protein
MTMTSYESEGTRKSKPFVAKVKTGEAESLEVSKASADAVPSFVG